MSTDIFNTLHINAINSVSKECADWSTLEIDCAAWGDTLNIISLSETETHYFMVAINGHWGSRIETFCCPKELWRLYGIIQSQKLKIAQIEEDLAFLQERKDLLKDSNGFLPLLSEMHYRNVCHEFDIKKNTFEKYSRHIAFLENKFEEMREDNK